MDVRGLKNQIASVPASFEIKLPRGVEIGGTVVDSERSTAVRVQQD
jgi:hypothetical protein